jgi:SAM-dependent methyltransferase
MTAAFWDNRSGSYDDRIKQHDATYVKTIESTRSLLTKSDMVLDFGCASGEISLDLAPFVQQLLGIDYSAGMIELANQKARDRRVNNVSFNQGDAFEPGLTNNSFSAIIAFDVFHLVDDLAILLARLNDLLAPGGLLISQTPCLSERGWFFRSIIGLAQKLGLVPEIRSLTFADLEHLVSGQGFELVETEIWDEKTSTHWIVARKD